MNERFFINKINSYKNFFKHNSVRKFNASILNEV